MSEIAQRRNYRRFVRLARWAIILVLVGLVTLSIGLGIYTQTDQFRAWVRDQIIVALRETVRGEVELGQISGFVWNGLVFHNLSIRDATGEVLQIPQATVAFKLLSQVRLVLESSTFRIDELIIQSPTLRVVQNSEGAWNVTQLFISSTETVETSEFQFFIDRMHIDNGSVIVEAHDRQTFRINGIMTEGRLAQTLDALEVDIAPLSFRAEYPQFPSLTWEGGITYTHTDSTAVFALREVTLRTADSQLQVSGIVENLAAPLFDLTAEVSRVSASELRALLPASLLRQDLSGRVQLHGTLQNLAAKADLQAPDGKATTIVKADIQKSPPHYEAAVDLDHVAIDKVARFTDVQGEVSGHIDFTGTDLDSGKVSFALRPTKLVVLNRAVGDGELAGSVVNRRIISSGKTHGQIGHLQWDGWLELGSLVAYEGTVTVRDCAVINVTKQPLTIGETTINADAWVSGRGTTWQDLVANARVTLLPSRVGSVSNMYGSAGGSVQQQRLTLEHVSLVANDATVHIQGQVEDLSSQSPRATLSYNAQTQDVAPWLQQVGYHGQGAVSLTGTATGPFNNLTVTGTASGSALRWQQTTIQHGTATYRLHAVGQAAAHGEVTAAVQQLEAGETWRNAEINVAIVRVQPLEVQTTIHAEGAQVQSLRAQVHARQKPTQWDVGIRDLTLQLPNGVWTQSRPTSLTVRTGQGAQVTVDQLVLQRGVHAIAVSGTLEERGSQNIQAQITQLPLADLRPFIRGRMAPSGARPSTGPEKRSAPRAGQWLVGAVASHWRPPARSLRGRDRRH